jgi:hypothetical protein
MLEDKVHFIKHDYIPILQTLTADHKAKWGKMDAQQMVEHMRDIFKLANGKIEEVFTVYAADPDKLLMHPVFGELDYDLQIRYLDKHVRHHLRQFGLVD